MKTHEQFISEISKINDNIIVIGKYIKSTEYILVKCKKCGHEWKTKPNYRVNLKHSDQL